VRDAIAAFALCMVVILVVVWFAWYSAGRQAEAYRRAGIEISQWDVFIGVKPPERLIRIEDRP
jgi:hypothetical protein